MLALKLVAFALTVAALDAHSHMQHMGCMFPSWLQGTWYNPTKGSSMWTTNMYTSPTMMHFMCDTMWNSVILYRAKNHSMNMDALVCVNHTMITSDYMSTQRLNTESMMGKMVLMVPMGTNASMAMHCNETMVAKMYYTKNATMMMMTTMGNMVTQGGGGGGSGANTSSEVSLAILLTCVMIGLLKKMIYN